MAFALKNGKFLVKNGKFCTSCCTSGGGDDDNKVWYEFMTVSVARIRSSWYEVTTHSHPAAGQRLQADDESAAAEEFIEGVTVSISGCSGHANCSCNGTSRNGSQFHKSGTPTADALGVITANYTIDACPSTYGREEQTHQITIIFRRVPQQ